jgi:hypothetical protein
MTTQAQRAAQRRTAPTVRVSLADLLDTGVSMLGDAMLPAGYGQIDDTRDVVEAIAKKADERIVRMHIVWDNPIDSLELEDVLEKMRETGAAMVTKVEEVTK